MRSCAYPWVEFMSQFLYLCECFSGEIPATLGRLTNVTQLDLTKNQLSGEAHFWVTLLLHSFFGRIVCQSSAIIVVDILLLHVFANINVIIIAVLNKFELPV